MEIALVSDTHWGVRNDSKVLLDHQKEFFSEQFFPTLEERKIDTIFHLGDLVDRRKYINFYTAHRLHEDFLQPAEKYDLYIIAGNHDVFYKSTNRINVFDQLKIESRYDRTCVMVDQPYEFTFDNRKMLFVPWINPENEQQSMEMIAESDADFLFGHLHIAGFEMFRGSIAQDGLDTSVFDKFTGVYTGHFHQKSTRKNINYIGAPYHMTWGDYPSLRGFHIFDTETAELEYIPNKKSLFNIVYYNDVDGEITDLSELPLGSTYVKVIVQQKSDPYKFDRYLETIEKQNPHDIRIIESFAFEETDEVLGETEDTQTIIMNTIDRLDVSCDKKELKLLMNDLFNDAISLERNE